MSTLEGIPARASRGTSHGRILKSRQEGSRKATPLPQQQRAMTARRQRRLTCVECPGPATILGHKTHGGVWASCPPSPPGTDPTASVRLKMRSPKLERLGLGIIRLVSSLGLDQDCTERLSRNSRTQPAARSWRRPSPPMQAKHSPSEPRLARRTQTQLPKLATRLPRRHARVGARTKQRMRGKHVLKGGSGRSVTAVGRPQPARGAQGSEQLWRA